MRRFKFLLIKRYNAVLAVLLSLLGFSTACDNGESPVEYGVPYATFIVSGNVKDEATNNNISDVRVVLNTDTAYTDASGNYEVSCVEFPEDQTFIVEFADVDGTTNGAYEAKDQTVEFIDPEFSGSSKSWDSGDTEMELNVKLKAKE
ncbi:radical SAM-associated putative lipoprotein [Plebeiibacterium sediminum]|uniref:Radical SAM-associated putative lipoprotein n=1 Tax=Plebeiibacterium sediminum TaxID=2992112 RepID=A0AAE3M4B6_9BACT|nr:radical SAM-associated putative lipoprotein [Plebeiobacterium sediminum]MCW3786982.1 radical SAM-associated putative lipoprotein [Plebeiobacterium sediminum]